jgi:hypothetical protein
MKKKIELVELYQEKGVRREKAQLSVFTQEKEEVTARSSLHSIYFFSVT